ncbi:MAG: META domain-containing protein [Flavobacterium sp.]
MYKFFFSISLFFLAVGCKTNAPLINTTTSKTTAAYQQQVENMEKQIYFRAMGNEPEWSLKIGENQIAFSSLKPGFEEFNSPYAAPVKAMDANVKRYSVATDRGTMIITIEQQICTNAMSGETFPYEVRIEIYNGNKTTATFSGCGFYVIPASLHDIWVLEKMNGENMTASKFENEIPYLEINSTTGKFMGFAGCNRINGELFFEKDVLRFTKIAATRMACGPKNRENELIHSLESTTTYQVANMRLTLTNPSGIELIFKKVD